MPTAARLTAAMCLAVLAGILSKMIIPLMPENTQFCYFIPINVALGLLAGWTVMGPRASRGITAGINNGFTGVLILILWGLATHSVREMLKKALLRRYDGMGEALIASISIAAEYFMVIATLPIAITVIVGGALSGVITNLVNRRYP
tara:strand:+ start:563 stop:1003 length:441 start_codon:yes stop_codon:yes gene_type:complete